MNPTEGPAGSTSWPLSACRWGFAALSAWLAFAPALAQDNPVPRPPQLERDVQFWIRVYTQIDTNSGFLHDQYDLAVVYETIRFAADATPSERAHQVDQARERYAAALRRIAAGGDTGLSPEDQRIKELWGAEGTAARLRAASGGALVDVVTSEVRDDWNESWREFHKPVNRLDMSPRGNLRHDAAEGRVLGDLAHDLVR